MCRRYIYMRLSIHTRTYLSQAGNSCLQEAQRNQHNEICQYLLGMVKPEVSSIVMCVNLL